MEGGKFGSEASSREFRNPRKEPPRQIVREAFQGKVIIFNVPEGPAGGVYSEQPKSRHQLPDPKLRTEPTDLVEPMQQVGSDVGVNQIRSPILALWPRDRRSWPITSTRIAWPGMSLATQVARVTPSTISSTPSAPSLVDPDRGHPVGRRAEASDLLLGLVRIGTRGTRRP
jgi:hypothetical protein